MKPIRYSVVLVLMSLVLSGCGGNSDSAPTATAIPAPTTSLTGVVIASGYLQGATVCLDKNSNLLCEPSEPQAVTNTQGQYTLKNILTSDSVNFAVIATVPVGAIDSNLPNEFISDTYTLTTPIGKSSVISPITTLVVELAFENSADDLTTISHMVTNRLQVENIDIFDNYNKNMSDTNKHLQITAKNVSYRFGKNLKKTDENNTSSSHLLKQRVATHYAWRDLLNDIPFYTSFPDIYSALSFDVLDDIKIDDKLAFLNRAIQPASINILNSESPIYSLTCLESISCKQGSEVNTFNYSQIGVKNTANQIVISDNIFEYNNKTQVLLPITKNKNYALMSSGWVETSRVILDPNRQKFNLYKIDISGLPINSTLNQQDYPNRNSDIISSNSLAQSEAIFPSNSYLYKLVRMHLVDEYYHDNSKSVISLNNEQITTLPLLKQFSFDGNPIVALSVLTMDDSESFKKTLTFDLQLNKDNSASLLTQSVTTLNSENLKEGNSGDWVEKNINSANLLIIKLTSHKPLQFFNQDFFYTVFDNKLIQGKVEKAGYVSEDFFYNQVAMDAIKSALIVQP